MSTTSRTSWQDYQGNLKNAFLLCIIGTALNCIGSQVSALLGLPLYLDTTGTILTAALGGYLPGIAVGFATNIIRSISDFSSAYYGTLNILIAVCAAYFAKRGYFKKPTGIFLSIITFTLIGGSLGSVLTWFLYGVDNANSLSIAAWINQNLTSNPFMSAFLADTITDALDKTIVVLMICVVLHFIPDHVYTQFYGIGWHQTPLSDDDLRKALKKYSRSVSLHGKILILLGTASLLIAAASTGVSTVLYRRSSIDEHMKLGRGVVNLVASVIDAQRVDEFLEKGEQAEDYLETEEQLYRIRESSPDIQYIYVYQILPDGCHVVFDLDTDDLEGGEPGEIVPFDESFSEYLPSLLAGEEIEPVISNDTYGWLMSIYQPVYDENGACCCYAAADISMDEIRFNEFAFLAKVISLFMGFFILILSFGFWLAEYNFTLPINTMALAAGSFAYNTEMAREESLEQIRRLGIRTGDEIENLYQAMVKTTNDTVDYIAEAQNKSQMLAKMQHGLILVLADLVESRDKCTGDHVRKTAAYAKIILDEMKKEGIHSEELTDEFIEEVVFSAPLHDIGKIHVPDALLNKPGRLTDDEFRQMKEHTTAGEEIIESAIGSIDLSDAGYLEEAKNLAAFHHERWDGSGYPRGLAGEEIPLSARVMAVADVFDALVSRRSYKSPFPFEKAMQIIREGSGTHFDPEIAGAFLRAEDQVRKVAEDHADI